MSMLASAVDIEEVTGVVRRSGTSFYRGMKILPPDRRLAMYAIYAFCRIVDDIADDPIPFADKKPALTQWRARIDALMAGSADDSVTRVLLAAARQFNLRRDDFVAVIDGMQMDAETVIVAPDLATLDLYCDRVAAAVGRLSVRAFGDPSEAAQDVAWHLGRALQLTNILRDLAEDRDRGRLYLPREWLEEEGVPLTPDEALKSPNMPRVCLRVAAKAHDHYREAEKAMRRCDRKAMRPARIMKAGYSAILAQMERRGWDRPAERVSVPRWRKGLIALRIALGLI